MSIGQLKKSFRCKVMNGPFKMNTFLQRMLKKSEEEPESEKIILENTTLTAENSPRVTKSPNLIKNLGVNSPSKLNPMATRSSPRPITPKLAGDHWNDIRRRKLLEPMESKNSMNNEEVSSLERLRREFEMGFLSPTKPESKEITNSRRFVKKIVAAFEQKYNACNDIKTETEKLSIEHDDSDDNSFEDEKTLTEMIEESTSFLGRTYVIDALESRLSHYLDSYESKSTFGEPSSDEEETSIDLGKCLFPMKEELRVSTPKQKLLERQETMTTTLLNSEMDVPKEEINETSMTTTSSINLVRTDSSIRRERKPKIVGAYLKKPIEVEDTSIDWIPITSKKLPRKRSFKKLLSMLTGKKTSTKSSKLYCSQMNLQEETSRELLHDSGYDEKSCSSSSLASLVSITDLVLQQSNDEYEMSTFTRRTCNMTTFRQSPVSCIEQDINTDLHDFPDGSSINDDFSDTCSTTSKKLLLEEVPRSELRLSLGPAFPSSGLRLNLTTSLDRRPTKPASSKDRDNFTTKIGFTPSISPLPKHPFVSMSRASLDNSTNDRYMTFPEFDKIDFRRNHQAWKFPNDDITYDVPRPYFSRSDPGISTIGRDFGNERTANELIYDLPKTKIRRRPRSSVYDDAVSLKRCNADSPCYSVPSTMGFYAFPSQDEPHYATIKPRNTKINPSREFLKTFGEPRVNETPGDDRYENRVFHGRTSF